MRIGLIAIDGCFGSAAASVIDIVRVADGARGDVDPRIDPIELAITRPQEPIKCTYRVYLDTPSTIPQNTPLALSLTGIQITRDTVSATATRADVLNKAFPANFYTVTQYPGLRR